MCGIVAFLQSRHASQQVAPLVHTAVAMLAHRGPDGQAHVVLKDAVLGHARLAIMGGDAAEARQPLRRGDAHLVVNGEIYNHAELSAELGVPRGKSDCAIVLELAARHRDPLLWLPRLRGMFSLVLHDGQHWTIARDHMGITPLYMGWMVDGVLAVASEMKALHAVCERVLVFPPGHVLQDTFHDRAPRRWYAPQWRVRHGVQPPQYSQLRSVLRAAVHIRCHAEARWGVLLSGGLDSSIVAALAAEVRSGLPSYAVGLAGSPDLARAAQMAAHLGLQHRSIEFTVSEGLDVLSTVIYHLETYDVTTIRASVPMYLLARAIREDGVKAVLSGEGSDEMFGGYLYFHCAPSAQALYDETVRKLERLHLYDCLRANKAMAACGVEARVPFLDPQVIEWAMHLHPKYKMVTRERCIEKHVLRSAFMDMLPPDVLWRRKEQFSDGVGDGWIAGLRAHAAQQITDEQLAHAALVFPQHTPQTKEQLLYRQIFALHFRGREDTVPFEPSVACSTGIAAQWDARFTLDPSGASAHVAAGL